MLFGDADPGGRLPVTFPADAAQLQTAGDPRKYPGVAEEEDYSESVFTGYKWYDAHNFTPAFPFGFGLSYTNFRYGTLRVSASHGANQVAVATIDVTNTGRRAGIAVPELYIRKPATSALAQPLRQLVGYDSVEIPPGRTVAVTFPLNDRSFATWDNNGWRIIPGCYKLYAGASSRSLPSHVAMARGAHCAGAAASLSTRGSFGLPLPARATSKLLPGEKPRLMLAVTPRRVTAGALTTLQFTVTERSGARTGPGGGAIIRFDGRKLRADRRGRARLTLRLPTPRLYVATALKPGWRSATATVRVVNSAPAFTG